MAPGGGRVAAEAGPALPLVAGAGRGGRILEDDVRRALAAPPAAAAPVATYGSACELPTALITLALQFCS